ncbi:MAG TPA: response regulator transcription factor [Polyangiaceae bacterium]|jgi:DNA-binding response OmpR family regulator|nr:response regulator transcription factor [Polyangiaceae bacterium]
MLDSREVEPAEAVRVLYVEDDERLARLTAQYLATHGVEAQVVTSGALAVSAVLETKPDLVLLDLMLPGLDGLEICRRLRARVDVPIIILTARNEEADRVLGLEGGADDYLSKPFSSRELLARIRANVRRARGKSGPELNRISLGQLVIDSATRSVALAGQRLTLTSYEFALLRALAERAGRVLSREQLLEALQGTSEEAFDRSIDVHVSRLRQKLEPNPKSPRYLKTIRGVGYVLVADEQ